ncbi:hypothetical protein HC931_11400 [Candidatus Gracilibacteria bacterium]|nr:hypothetical protein [Candidatus Gracilibacteria bacterium]NJP20933.1 hypothetical protein [Hydrococcus sp. CRU_1_1]
MIKTIVLLFLLILLFIGDRPAQAASVCRKSRGDTICILNIKRSAKYHWQYLATVSINGVERPMEIYNCRDRFRIQNDSKVQSFKPNGAGELICSFFGKR